ncbi:signal peptidase I [Anaerococcus murdochii]|uniref:Signal peptidase I n=1 Tax=Anaerococcus murdochii TaxID=411577 RepID=A0ABS7T063_9FIRM|nr:signal peptidase I [Anaerococcus murdochii]MBZ2387177.1 signal peptidase I [Anaerococcus murdochii]
MNEENKQIKKENSLLNTIWDWVKTILIALAITFFVKAFIIDATRVAGKSMLNTLHDGDMLMVNKIGKHFRDYKRGEIVILHAPDYPNRLYVKRVIGTPGDLVELKDGDVYINGEKLEEKYVSVDETLAKTEQTGWVLGDKEYLVFGDNRANSNDSRDFGQIYKEEIVGHAFFRIYPFEDAGLIDNNPYGN